MTKGQLTASEPQPASPEFEHKAIQAAVGNEKGRFPRLRYFLRTAAKIVPPGNLAAADSRINRRLPVNTSCDNLEKYGRTAK